MARTLEDIGKEFSEFNTQSDGGILRIIQNWGNEFIKALQNNLLKKKSKATGQLYEKIEPSFKQTDTGYKMTISMMDYWKYIEDGRPPTKGGGNGKVYRNIFEWIKYKPDLQREIARSPDRIAATKSLAYVITRKIHREGTQPKPFIAPALKQVTTQTLAERVGKYIADTLGEP